jgi:hypothetical protein
MASALLASALIGLSLENARGAADPYATGDAAEGAKLVQSSGCEGCHGAGFAGGLGPKLVGIEKTKTAEQIAEGIKNPKAPMPDFGFSAQQIANIVAYVSSLSGTSGAPVIKVVPPNPTSGATVLVTFTGTPPTDVQVQAWMQMGTTGHGTGWLPLQKTDDPHTLAAKVEFSMGGAWTIKVRYPSGKEIDVPLYVGS